MGLNNLLITHAPTQIANSALTSFPFVETTNSSTIKRINELRTSLLCIFMVYPKVVSVRHCEWRLGDTI